MGADNQPKHRRIERDLRRKSAIRNRIERLLIVCEGSKTEPQYIDEIRQDLRLTTTHIRVIGPGYGTDPLSVVDYAEHLFLNGDRRQKISPREFDRIVTVFDRDDHEKYYPALEKIANLETKLINDEKSKCRSRPLCLFLVLNSGCCFTMKMFMPLFIGLTFTIDLNCTFKIMTRVNRGYGK